MMERMYKRGDRARHSSTYRENTGLAAHDYDAIKAQWRGDRRPCGCLAGYSMGVRADYCVGKVTCVCCKRREDCALIFGEPLCGDCLHGDYQFKRVPQGNKGAHSYKDRKATLMAEAKR